MTRTRPTGSGRGSGTAAVLQRKCACGTHTPDGGTCPKCGAAKKTGVLQRSAGRAGEVGDVPPVVYDVLREPGSPLDGSTRAYFEPRFGADFGDVRVHTGPRAAESAAAVNARAYTVGRDVVFNAGQYTPGTADGGLLLAHELTHTLQQGGGDSGLPAAVAPATGPYEREADERAASTMAGERAAPTTGRAAAPVVQKLDLSADWAGLKKRAQDKMAGLEAKAEAAVHQVAEGAGQAYEAAKAEVKEVATAAVNTGAKAVDAAVSAAGEMKQAVVETAGEVAQAASAKAAALKKAAAAKASAVAGTVRQGAGRAHQAITDTASSVQQKTAKAYEAAKQKPSCRRGRLPDLYRICGGACPPWRSSSSDSSAGPTTSARSRSTPCAPSPWTSGPASSSP